MARSTQTRATTTPLQQTTNTGYKGPGVNYPRKYVKGSLSDAYMRNTGIRQKTPEVEYRATCKSLGIDPNSRIVSQLEVDGAPVVADELLGGEHVSLRDTYTGEVGFIAILPLLYMNKRWISLDASSNGLRNEAVVHLVDMLLQPQHMTGRRIRLDLSKNLISERAGRALIELVRTHPHIEEINVRMTKVPPRVVATLREALRVQQNRHAVELRKAQEAQAAELAALSEAARVADENAKSGPQDGGAQDVVEGEQGDPTATATPGPDAEASPAELVVA